MDRIALLTTLLFVSRRVPVVVESRALRRPEIVVRRTRYCGVVVDERLLTGAFAPSGIRGRLQAFLPLRGSVQFGGESSVRVGEAVLLRPEHQALFRYDDAEFLEIEWNTEVSVDAPTRLGVIVDAAPLAAGFDDSRLPQVELFARALDTFRRAGVPLGTLHANELRGAPSERDERIAQAIAAQFGTIATKADTTALGELARLSPRQLQRVYAEFCAKYGMHLASWRDTRNRWRVQLAAVLLSRPDLAQAEIAADVGYGSTPALARAFSRAGFPSPGEVRRLLADQTFSDPFRTSLRVPL